MENKQQQADEIEALSSIYGEKWKCENESGTSFSIDVGNQAILFITMNEMYPSESPPTYELQAPYLNKADKANIDMAFSDIYLNHIGEPVIYEWIEKLKEYTLDKTENNTRDTIPSIQEITHVPIQETAPDFSISHGDVITDRRSSFQGHVCAVNTKNDVQLVMEKLLTNKKILQATHNILAYRIKQENGLILQDCDDDGESSAGSRMLHLLNVLDVSNVMVVVSRWYGGTLLGPDRFKHINNAARDALVKAKVIV